MKTIRLLLNAKKLFSLLYGLSETVWNNMEFDSKMYHREHCRNECLLCQSRQLIREIKGEAPWK